MIIVMKRGDKETAYRTMRADENLQDGDLDAIVDPSNKSVPRQLVDVREMGRSYKPRTVQDMRTSYHDCKTRDYFRPIPTLDNASPKELAISLKEGQEEKYFPLPEHKPILETDLMVDYIDGATWFLDTSICAEKCRLSFVGQKPADIRKNMPLLKNTQWYRANHAGDGVPDLKERPGWTAPGYISKKA